jgi:hypothetical protein
MRTSYGLYLVLAGENAGESGECGESDGREDDRVLHDDNSRVCVVKKEGI